MYETSTAFLHFDTPGPDRTLPAGRSRLQGWLVSKPGWHYTDLRIAVGQEIFPGVHGHPRRDLADYFKSNRPYLLAGFDILVELPVGQHRLTLEACSITGAWEVLEQINVEAKPGGETIPVPAEVPGRALEFGETLRVLLRRMGAGCSPAAGAADIVATTPRPHYLRHPHQPFHGHLDQPQAWARSVFGRIAISGWIFHEALAIKRVFATTDLQAVQTLSFGRGTPFLAALHPGFASALCCGFDGFIDLPAQLPQPVTVRLYVELEDGSWHLGSVVRVVTTDHEFAKQPLARFSPLTFLRAWRALHRAVTASGVTLKSKQEYRQEIGRIWRDYAARAPRRNSARAPTGKSAAAISGSGPDKISHVHYFTHNLSHEGAPLFLLEHARHLRRETGATVTVTSGQEGPLRREVESLGALVLVIDASSLLTDTRARALQRTLDALATSVDLSKASLVIANTLSAYWGVHLAHRAGRPVLFYIHESTPPRSFFRGFVPPAALALVEESFRLADRVSFLTATSRRYFTGLTSPANFVLHPGWIDLAGIDRFCATHSRDTERARLGIAPEKKLIINLGTVCDRKGQHLFARAVDLLWRNVPAVAASTEFLMVGGGETAYDRELADFLVELNRPNLRIIPGTRDVYPYYRAADLFVCSSYEESFPRVILEAMAMQVPILSTNVHGIPEIVGYEEEALLVAPGDSSALAHGLIRLLNEPAIARRYATQARTRVETHFDAALLLPRHLAFAQAVQFAHAGTK